MKTRPMEQLRTGGLGTPSDLVQALTRPTPHLPDPLHLGRLSPVHRRVRSLLRQLRSRPDAVDGARPGAIDLRALSVGYGEREVFSNLSLSIEPGSLNFLVGPSGSGKSTLLRLLYGTLKPHRGTAWVDGIALHRLHHWQVPRLRRRIGCVFQSFELLPHLSALENVLVPLQLAHPRLRDPEAYARDALDLVGLADRSQALATELSGGQQQRVAIARAIAHEPRILLADEPTGNLDIVSTNDVMALFLQLHALGSTVIVSTHDEALLGRYPGNVISLW